VASYTHAIIAAPASGEEAMGEGLIAVVVVMVFLAGMAYAVSAANQAPRAEAADELPSCGGGCGTCSVRLPCVRERGHSGDHRCRNEHRWPSG
jgi:hypothetical protein